MQLCKKKMKSISVRDCQQCVSDSRVEQVRHSQRSARLLCSVCIQMLAHWPSTHLLQSVFANMLLLILPKCITVPLIKMISIQRMNEEVLQMLQGISDETMTSLICHFSESPQFKTSFVKQHCKYCQYDLLLLID